MLNRRWQWGLLLALMLQTAAVAAQEAVWSALKEGGQVVFLRHAQTVAGIGDPAGFVIADCATQRNLSNGGKADAAAIGEAFRRRAIPVAEVLSSRWCRCLDTARIGFGKVKPAPMLDSMFNDPQRPDQEKLAGLKSFMRTWKSPGNLVLVTHAVNIQRLTGVSPNSGEMVVTRFIRGRFDVIGRLSITPP